MKSTFECFVIFLICNRYCCFCELELYPDFQRPENSINRWPETEENEETRQQIPYENNGEKSFLFPPNYGLSPPIPRPNVPSRPTYPLHLKDVNYGSRISEIAKHWKDAQRKLIYDHVNAKSLIEKMRSSHFGPFFNPNLHILDDVRQIGDSRDHSGINLNEERFDETAEEFENSGREEDEEDENRLDKDDDSTWNIVEDNSEFAYLPSDPRYYQDELQNTDTKSVEKEENGINLKQEYQTVSVNSRNDQFQKDSTRPREYHRYLTRNEVEMIPVEGHRIANPTGMYLIAIVAGISAAATVGLIAFAIGWYNLQKHVKNASDVDYPAYGITGPNKEISPSSGDRRLAQSAQMYHYQHQKQQIIAMERAATAERNGSVSEADSEEENEEGDYTVYECPGLAPTGEMEVKNPLFEDDPTPAAQTPSVKQDEGEKK